MRSRPVAARKSRLPRKSKVKEKVIVKKLRAKLKETVGGTWKKIHGGMYQDAGILDLIGCVKGRYAEIEVKRPGKLSRVSDLQQARIEEVTAEGGLAFATDDVDSAVERVQKWLKHVAVG